MLCSFVIYNFAPFFCQGISTAKIPVRVYRNDGTHKTVVADGNTSINQLCSRAQVSIDQFHGISLSTPMNHKRGSSFVGDIPSLHSREISWANAIGEKVQNQAGWFYKRGGRIRVIFFLSSLSLYFLKFFNFVCLLN